jgi:hypothetical protein
LTLIAPVGTQGVVNEAVTTWLKTGEVLGAKFVSPLYVAVTECVPVLNVESARVAKPLVNVTAGCEIPSMLRDAVPVGTLPVEDAGATATVKVTKRPTTAGSAVEATTVLVWEDNKQRGSNRSKKPNSAQVTGVPFRRARRPRETGRTKLEIIEMNLIGKERLQFQRQCNVQGMCTKAMRAASPVYDSGHSPDRAIWDRIYARSE